MSLQANDRVVCIDATPIPINAPGFSLPDFAFPGGFIEEGAVYCIADAYERPDGPIAVTLVGHPVLLRGHEIAWNAERFRKLKGNANSLTRIREEPQDAS